MRIGAPFAWLKEEVNATFWPNHATIALREHSWAACPVPKPLKRIIETVEIVEPTHALPPLDFFRVVPLTRTCGSRLNLACPALGSVRRAKCGKYTSSRLGSRP